MTQSRLANAHNDGMDSYGHIISPQSQVLEGEYDRTKFGADVYMSSRPPTPSVPPIRFRRCRLLPYLCRADTSTSLDRGQTASPRVLRDWIEIIARTFSLK